jgi:hypothetical protein
MLWNSCIRLSAFTVMLLAIDLLHRMRGRVVIGLFLTYALLQVNIQARHTSNQKTAYNFKSAKFLFAFRFDRNIARLIFSTLKNPNTFQTVQSTMPFWKGYSYKHSKFKEVCTWGNMFTVSLSAVFTEVI